jgi:ABC-type dipeptide/oligopeptide/nickel transport system permease component
MAVRSAARLAAHRRLGFREILGVQIGLFSAEAILPVMALTLLGVAGLARYMRRRSWDVLDQDYVEPRAPKA